MQVTSPSKIYPWGFPTWKLTELRSSTLASHLWNPFSTRLGSHAPLVKEQGYKMDLWKDI